MTTVPVGFHNVTFIFRAAGGTRDATFQIGIVDNASPAQPPETVVTQVRADFQSAGAPGDPTIYSDQWRFLGCSDSYTDEVGVIVYQDLVNVPGTVTSKPVPINGALLVKKQTALGGRRNRGRLFCPPISMDEGTVDVLGNIASATLAIIGPYWDAFYDELDSHELAPVLFHSEAPFTPTPITGFQLQGTLATQRRRMRK